MSKPPQAESTSFSGPAGRLEALIEQPDADTPVGVAVVCHPHPQQGGSMQNKVAHMLARSFTKTGHAALRFNFRGVGGSDGQFAEGDGEVEDVLAAVDVARKRYPDGSLWLAGFSFGAAMAIRAAAEVSVDGLVSVAPAAYRFAGDLSVQPDCPWLVVHGEDDEVVPVQESIDWINGLNPGPELRLFPATGHFFHGKLVDLRTVVVDFIEQNTTG